MSNTAAQFLPRRLATGREARYTVYLPPDYAAGRLWPVIVSLHGAGECGRDGVLPSEAGLGEALRRFPERYPFIVVFPQTATDRRYWTDEQDTVLAELSQTVREFHGDPRRVSLTGYSLGGAGAWFLAARHPGEFAALVPICGRIAIKPDRARDLTVRGWVTSRDPSAAVAGQIGRLPVWVFHGADDPIVPVSESRRMVATLKARGSDVHYTEYAHSGHGAWVPAYADPALPPWLLSRRLASTKDAHAP